MSEFLPTSLARLASQPEEEFLAALGPLSDEDVPFLEAVASGEGDFGRWGRVAAVRLLARVRGGEAACALLRVLDRVRELEDRRVAEVMLALECLGPAVLQRLVSGIAAARDGVRELIVEVALRIVADFEVPAEPRRALREQLERQFLHSLHPGDRSLYAGYLGDLGDPEAVPVLFEGLASPTLSEREYEALQEAMERLGVECPAYYFDPEGRACPLDDDGQLSCPVCGQSLQVDGETGRPVHSDGSSAAH